MYFVVKKKNIYTYFEPNCYRVLIREERKEHSFLKAVNNDINLDQYYASDNIHAGAMTEKNLSQPVINIGLFKLMSLRPSIRNRAVCS